MQLCEVADTALIELIAHISKELAASPHKTLSERLGWIDKRCFTFTIKRLKELIRKKLYIPLKSDKQA